MLTYQRDRTLGQVMNYIFTIVILALIMTFGIVAFNGFIGGVDLTGEGVQNPYIAGLQVFGLTLILREILQNPERSLLEARKSWHPPRP